MDKEIQEIDKQIEELQRKKEDLLNSNEHKFDYLVGKYFVLNAFEYELYGIVQEVIYNSSNYCLHILCSEYFKKGSNGITFSYEFGQTMWFNVQEEYIGRVLFRVISKDTYLEHKHYFLTTINNNKFVTKEDKEYE